MYLQSLFYFPLKINKSIKNTRDTRDLIPFEFR